MKENVSKNNDSNVGRLIICPTPLGNLGDITKRTLDALRCADAVLAEDTRVSAKLLASFGIQKTLIRLDEASFNERIARVLGDLASGAVLAYCSDAGMPGISDPGMRLIRAARKEGCAVEVLPGASAVTLAYVQSASHNTHFYFGAFFPRKASERKKLLQALSALDAALIFYESPKRLLSTLKFLSEFFPMREACVCREMTKLHEEIVRLPLPGLYLHFLEHAKDFGIKGEAVIVIDGPAASEQKKAPFNDEELVSFVRTRKESGFRTKEIARALAIEQDISISSAYELVIKSEKP